jgi:cobalt-zinc-cadmium efflux system membrane fusion protein
MRWVKRSLNNISILAVLVLFGAACNRQKESEPEKQKGFVLTDSMSRKIGISTALREIVENELKLTAKIESDQDKTVDVFALVGGRVNQVKVNLGDVVTKGQSMATILSGEVASAEKDLLAAESNLAVAKRRNSAAYDMFKSGLISDKDLLQSKTDVDVAEAELGKAKNLIQIYGSRSQGYFDIKAPISGYVIKKSIADNEDVKNDLSTPVFSIVDLSKVWVMANVSETDIQKVQVGYNAEITTIAYPDSIMTGKIDKVFNVLDPESKVMKARIILDNKNGMLKPEMFAKVTLRYKEANEKVCVPSSAIIFDKNRYFVMVFKSKNDIETRQIQIYRSTSNKTYIESGLNDGEQIISKYQLLVYDAIND